MEQHSDDLRKVREGDTLEIETTEGETLDVECTSRQVQNADPRSGEIRETKIWQFETDSGSIAASIIDGLKSSSDEADFPRHSELWHMDEERNLGYIESLTLLGEMEA